MIGLSEPSRDPGFSRFNLVLVVLALGTIAAASPAKTGASGGLAYRTFAPGADSPGRLPGIRWPDPGGRPARQRPERRVRLGPAGGHLDRHLGHAGRVPRRRPGGADALRRRGARGLRRAGCLFGPGGAGEADALGRPPQARRLGRRRQLLGRRDRRYAWSSSPTKSARSTAPSSRATGRWTSRS